MIYTAKPVVNMHITPNSMSEVCSQTLYGEALQILETTQDGLWVKIQTSDNYIGYIKNSDYINTPQSDCKPSRKIAKIKNIYAHLYHTNSITAHPPLMTLPCSIQLEVISEPACENYRWIEVQLIEGKAAWIRRGDVIVDPKPLTFDEMLRFSIKFIGLPYTWGGTSSFGFDCSGFVQFLYRNSGIELPRDARQQIVAPGMQPIQTCELKGADFIFFGKTPEKISHVGLYLKNNIFIHASALLGPSPTVQIGDITSPKIKDVYPFILPARLERKRNFLFQ